MNPADFVDCLVETFDKSARAVFQDWLAHKRHVRKWFISADFVLRDKTRPNDSFAFTIMPADVGPDELKKEVAHYLPRDLKNSRAIDSKGIAWLRDDRHFHIMISMKRDRVFYHWPELTPRETVRKGLLELAEKFSDQPERARRFKNVAQKAAAKNFNVGLFSDLSLLGLYLPLVSLLLLREVRAERVGWLCDRDAMTSYCDGILWDYAILNLFGFAERYGVDRQNVLPDIAGPAQTEAGEVMWYDDFVRAPDWMAGTIAAWNRETGELPPNQEKYVDLVQEVLADLDNGIILSAIVEKANYSVTRLKISSQPPLAEVQPPADQY